MAGQLVPLIISVAPFPEGFQGDMDETWQQGVLLMSAYIEGNFLTGLILPPGSTLPSSDQGPIAMGGIWYFWDPATQQYLPQVISTKVAKNFAKNCVYQVQQTGSTIPITVAGVTPVYDMSIARVTVPNVVGVTVDVGPPASADNDFIPSAIKYTVGPALVPTPAASDLCVHEHVLEGSDIASLQGQTLSLSFSAWTNTPGTYSVYLTNSGRDHSYVSTFLLPATTWTRIKIPGIPPLPTTSGTWNFSEGTTGLYVGVAMLVGSQWQTTTPNSWKPVFAAGMATNLNMLTVVNNQLDVTGIKLEAAPGASYLSVPPFEDDLEALQRYFFTNFSYQSTSAGMCGLHLNGQSAGNAAGSFAFPRRMAKVPTISLKAAVSLTANALRNLTTGVDVTAFAAVNAFQKGVSFNGAITTPAGAKGDVFEAYITADARLS